MADTTTTQQAPHPPHNAPSQAVVGRVIRRLDERTGRATGWGAYTGTRHLTDFNTAREAKAAVEREIRQATTAGVRWHRPAPGRYEAVMR